MVNRRSHYDDEEGFPPPGFGGKASDKPQGENVKKPCRTCTDFKSHMQSMKEDSSVECPADRSELGRATWTLLHTMSVNLPETSPLEATTRTALGGFVKSLSMLYPCDHCAEDFREDLKENPPRFSSGKDFATWLCEAHNRVNVKLDKPSFDCSKIYYRWRDAEC
uniref:Sulfhydryl oxidase n=1 Tax=Caligus rogercresseyi TaxID=217165 RepID=C1BMF4_CALRO|nr:FAD-linked sulfhydryl oxidase ALR [Caligus rogercresseyi]